MKKQYIEKKIEALEERQFLLSMKTRWEVSDYQLNTELAREVRALKNLLRSL